MGLVDSATQTANTAIQGLVSQTNEQNAGNLALALDHIAQAAMDGNITTEEYNTALAILNGTMGVTVTATQTMGSQMQTTATGPAKIWEDELRTINGLVDGAAGDYEINFDVSVTGDPIPSYDDSGGGGHNNAFASGTDGWRTVPSGYENDNYPVFLSSGEKFAVVPPGESLPGGGGSGGEKNIYVTVNANVASQIDIHQLADELADEIARR